MKIYINILGKIIMIELESFETIEKIKQIIQHREGISPDNQQKLIFNGKRLKDDDNKTLSEYDIKDESIIYLF